MNVEGLITSLLAQEEAKNQGQALQRAYLKLIPVEVEELAEGLLEKVISLQWSDTQKALQTADLILLLAEISGEQRHRALGLRARAQTLAIGLGEYKASLPLYEEALAIYRESGDLVGQATLEVTRIWALASLGRYEEAIKTGEWAGLVLESHAQWRTLATLHNNLASVFNRAGDFRQALERHNLARQAYLRLEAEGQRFLANTELNRAYVLYEMGELEASLEASQVALDLSDRFALSNVAAMAQHNLGLTYFRLGQPNRALRYFELAQEGYLGGQQRHNAAMCELSSTECLLELGRYQEVLEKSRQVLVVFSELEMKLEAAETIYIRAQVYIKTKQYPQAIASLSEARKLFEEQGNRFWIALADLDMAVLWYLQREFEKSQATAEALILAFEQLGNLVEKAQAHLLAARAATALGNQDQALEHIVLALEVAQTNDLPLLGYQAHLLLGKSAHARGEVRNALDEFHSAILALERLRGNVMVEHQASFLEGKEAAYQEAVEMCLEKGLVEQAFRYAERAKSRALLDILAYRVDLSLRAHSERDEPLVAELLALRQAREQLLRSARRVGHEKTGFDPVNNLQLQQDVQRIEGKITSLWHRLLVRNADYMQEASMWQVPVDLELPVLPVGTLLLEYFEGTDGLILFLLSGNQTQGTTAVKAIRLPGKIEQQKDLYQRLLVNLHAAPFTPTQRIHVLTAQAQAVLKRLYDHLLEPVGAELLHYDHLVIVPHGLLHYLPFHAFYDGRSFLAESHQVSYLPGASFIHYTTFGERAAGDVVAVGHSHQGELPYAILEANMVAEQGGGRTLLEGAATRAAIQELASTTRLLHFACHGDFHPDNPLFSGLDLADGQLTTLDIFNLQLVASLVTLSACETGRSLISGGDELLGLMRAFLAAGAASLLLSHWLVEDRSTSQFMQAFYRGLFQGETKGAALRAAQLSLLKGEDPRYAHPYFWAPFSLIGDAGRL